MYLLLICYACPDHWLVKWLCSLQCWKTGCEELLEALATKIDNYQLLLRRANSLVCSPTLTKLHIGALMIYTGLQRCKFSVLSAVWYCHRQCNIFESLGFTLLWWMDAVARRYCCSQRFWVAALCVCLRASFSVHEGLVEPIHSESVKSKRPAGADVPIKQVELAPATHQLNPLIKMR